MKAMYNTAPASILTSIFHHKELLWELVKRDFVGRYKGSAIGIVWSLLQPVLMLAIYTIVFSVAFKARWGTGDENRLAFAVILFSGMIVHGFFGECLNRAPSIITSHPNYVKKVVFPLEILPCMVLCSALLQFLVSLVVLLGFCLLAAIPIHLGLLLIPIVLLPLILFALGLSWLLAALGVYLRDLAHGMGIVTTILLFLSPVFYPIDALPERYRMFIEWNPITQPIIQLRNVLLWGKPLDWQWWCIGMVFGVMAACLGYWFFQRARRSFADVL